MSIQSLRPKMFGQVLRMTVALQQAKVGFERIGEPSVLDPLSKEKVSRRLRLDDTKVPAFADSASTATSTMRYAMSVLTSTPVRRGRNHVSDFDHYPDLASLLSGAESSQGDGGQEGRRPRRRRRL